MLYRVECNHDIEKIYVLKDVSGEELLVLLPVLMRSGYQRITLSNMYAEERKSWGLAPVESLEKMMMDQEEKPAEMQPEIEGAVSATGKKLLSIKEMSKLINYSEETIRGWVRKGDIKPALKGKGRTGKIYLDPAGVSKFINGTDKCRPYYD